MENWHILEEIKCIQADYFSGVRAIGLFFEHKFFKFFMLKTLEFKCPYIIPVGFHLWSPIILTVGAKASLNQHSSSWLEAFSLKGAFLTLPGLVWTTLPTPCPPISFPSIIIMDSGFCYCPTPNAFAICDASILQYLGFFLDILSVVDGATCWLWQCHLPLTLLFGQWLTGLDMKFLGSFVACAKESSAKTGNEWFVSLVWRSYMLWNKYSGYLEPGAATTEPMCYNYWRVHALGPMPTTREAFSLLGSLERFSFPCNKSHISERPRPDSVF